MHTLSAGLGCPVGSFPCRYLGIPLSIRKLTPEQFQGVLDAITRKLPTWRASSMDKAGHLASVQSVLCAMPIHAMMALDLPPQVIASLNKMCRSFLWAGKADATGGQCTVAWETVCSPKWTAGLVLPNFCWLNYALRARWLWLQRVDSDRPWVELGKVVPTESKQIFHTAVFVNVGD